MIHPNMATLLGVLCTDAPVSPSACASLLPLAVARSFNAISIDGDTSTNDTVALLANGAAAPSSSCLIPDDATNVDYRAFRDVLTDFAQRLSHLVVRDGEGATKFVAIRVTHAPSEAVARKVANSVAKSPLVKTALYGGDANWGRILCAVGYTEGLAEGDVRPWETSVGFVPTGSKRERGEGELRLLVDGEPMQVDEQRAAELLAEEDLEVWIRLRRENGGEEATVWTCDFSKEYVSINGDYRT
jgi:glutamate N-acetyltransferase/amino-acid N-acetyltransferase